MQHVALLEVKNNPFTIVKGKGDKNIHSIDEDFHIIIYSRLGITTRRSPAHYCRNNLFKDTKKTDYKSSLLIVFLYLCGRITKTRKEHEEMLAYADDGNRRHDSFRTEFGRI